MGNDDDRFLFEQTQNRAHDFLFGFLVKRRSRFVQNQNRRIPEYDPRNCQTLFLSSGKRSSSFANDFIQAVREFFNEIAFRRVKGRSYALIRDSSRESVGHVLPNASFENPRLLGKISDVSVK